MSDRERQHCDLSEPLASAFFLPATALSSFAAGYILRDTRRLKLSKSERFNRFPASPLCSVSWVLDGEIVLAGTELPMPKLSFSGPQPEPVLSYNPGSVYALTLAIYPEAWRRLTGKSPSAYMGQTIELETVVEPQLLSLFTDVFTGGSLENRIKTFERELIEQWAIARPHTLYFAPKIQDWLRSLVAQAATSSSGKSLRQLQRRVRTWTGQTQRELTAHARMESLFSLWINDRGKPQSSLAELAAESGFADQSHMGREVKRLIGLSPGNLNRLIDNDESFWFYRLMGERY